MIGRPFDIESFYAAVQATAKERNPLRQDIVRGLKDYYEATYGYDRYGAETVLMVPQRMGGPYLFGFALRRILHDRRISDASKLSIVRRALELAEYGEEWGIPFAIFGAILFLARTRHLELEELRFVLAIKVGEDTPFRGLDRAETVEVFAGILTDAGMPPVERAFWAHCILARHQDEPGAGEMIDLLLGSNEVPVPIRRELATAWVNLRQPRLEVPLPESADGWRTDFIRERMQFWIAHMPSWPTSLMVRRGVVWLARLGADPAHLARRYIQATGTFSEQLQSAVADILAEHHRHMREQEVMDIIECGIGITGSAPVRRKFYRLGTDLFGPEYLERAATDTASSVRQWAVRNMSK